MVKSELITRLCLKLPQLEPNDVELAVNCILNLMMETLESGERIEIRDFGSFSVRYREARQARNPKTGEQVHLPRKTALHFKPGKQLKDRVNASRDKHRIKKD